MVTPQLIVSTAAGVLILVGVLGIHVNSKMPIIEPEITGQSHLKVVEDVVEPSATGTMNLQGATPLQRGQTPSLQSPVGNQLQPNAGAENLPKDY